MIYIDPPYNTGNDFIYRDDFAMSSQKYVEESGAVDDNEQENLKKICDEFFGTENFVFQIAWRRTDNQPNIGSIARVKEYIKCIDFIEKYPIQYRRIKYCCLLCC